MGQPPPEISVRPAKHPEGESKGRPLGLGSSVPLGVAKNNSMTLATSGGLYAAISKELDGNLIFPGSETFYTLFESFTYSRLHAQFNLWAALEPKCPNQAFNAVNEGHGKLAEHVAEACEEVWMPYP